MNVFQRIKEQITGQAPSDTKVKVDAAREALKDLEKIIDKMERRTENAQPTS